MALPPGMRGKGSTKLLKTAFTFLYSHSFEAIDEIHDLSLQSQELGTRLTKLPVVVGESLHGGNPATATTPVEWAFCRPPTPEGLRQPPTRPPRGHRLRLNYSYFPD